jgi:hypothetical protein
MSHRRHRVPSESFPRNAGSFPGSGGVRGELSPSCASVPGHCDLWLCPLDRNPWNDECGGLAPRLKGLWETVEVARSSLNRPARRAEPVEEIKVKRTKAQRVLALACGPALGVLLAVPLGGIIAGAAGADSSTCYTACPTVVTNTPSVAPADGPATAAATSSTSPVTSSGLAFTGADIEEMAVIGVVAIGVGAVLVRGRRRTA